MKTFLEYLKENYAGWKMFSALSIDEKVNRLIEYPYDSSKYYHVFDPKNLESIKKNGVIGEAIWVSKGKPWENYNKGWCLELDLTGMNINHDIRWDKKDGTFIVTGPIDSSRITKVFEYLDKIDEREDVFASKASKDSVVGLFNSIKSMILRYGL